MRLFVPGLFVLGLISALGVNCGASDGVKIMCDSPQKELSCLVDPYFQFKCKEECKAFKHLEKQVGGYPELFSLPALAVMNSKVTKENGNSECVDIAPYCQLIAVNIGGFYRCSLSALTRYQCPKSCGACPLKNSSPMKETPPLSFKQLSPKLAAPNTCRDKLPICKSLFAQYACVNDFTFKQQCPVSCGLCTPDEEQTIRAAAGNPIEPSACQDQLPVCKSVYARFACNEFRFKQQCPVACGLCTPSDKDAKMEAVERLGAPVEVEPAGTCSDKLPVCNSTAAKYACLHDPHFVTECPLTCGLCQPTDDNSGAYGSFKPAAKCTDKQPMCLTVYAQFACTNDPHFVSQCPVTCGVCQPDADLPSNFIDDCKDVSTAFCQWVTDSMCGFMDIRQQCPAKCGLCTSETSDLEVVRERDFLVQTPADYDYETNATTAAAPSTTEEPDNCQDVLPPFICKAFWAKFACADNASDFRFKCKKSCGFCPSDLRTTTQSVSTCKDEFPKFVCHAYWAKFACSNKHSGFIKKCRKSCGYCPEQFGEEADLVQTEQTEQDDEMEYSEKSDSVQKLETLLAHYYLKLEQAPEELFDYESQEICGSEYMKKFGCAHDAVASVFCKDTCMNVIGQLMHRSPVMSMLQMGVLDDTSAEGADLDDNKIGTSVSTVVGGCLGIVALVSVVLGVTLKIVAHRRSQRLYSKL